MIVSASFAPGLTIRTRSARVGFAQFPVGMDHVERYPGIKRLHELMLHLLQNLLQLSTFNIIMKCILFNVVNETTRGVLKRL